MSETPQYSDQPYVAPSAVSLPPENVQRGTVLALVIIPAGVIAWTLLWSIGFIASIVAFGVAFGALALYRFGSGGAVGRGGAIRVTVITIVTLALSFVAGLAARSLPIWMQQHRQSLVEALVDPAFWAGLARASATTDIAISLLLAAVFGLIGCFSVLRTAFAQSRAAQPAPVAPDAVSGQPMPPVPPIPPVVPGEQPPRA